MVVVTALAGALLWMPTVAGAKRPSERLLAHRILHPAVGGHVKAPGGARIYVPRHVLSADSLVTITRHSGGRYDFHINQAWNGRVRVTLPRKQNAEYVMHNVGGIWVREGQRGKRSAWVQQLSLFTWLGDQIKLKACLTRNPAAFLNCLRKKGLAQLTGPLVEWFLNVVPNDFSAACKETLKSSTAIEFLYNALFSSECIATASAPSVPQPSRPTPQPAPQLGSQPQPAPQPSPQPGSQPQPAPQARGFRIEDVYLGGTWARTDPNDGTWYSKGHRPPNGVYWYSNGLGVGVDCARRAAGYTVTFVDGRRETWNVWFHVTDGKWYPSAASAETQVNDSYGLPAC